MTDSAKICRADAIMGCLIAGALGDALGGPHEGAGGDTAASERALVLSDDTQLTLATCEAIQQAQGVDPEAIAAGMLRWFRAGRVTGLGASTLKALRDLAQGGHWALVGRKGERAAGNGAAMRIAPLAFHLDPDNARARRIIRDVCRITHHNEEAYVGALALVVALRAAITGLWPGDDTLLTRVIEALPDSGVRDRLEEFAAQIDTSDLATLATRHGASGYVVESVPLALAAVQQYAHREPAEMFTALIRCGGDTDTNASMAGQLLGTLIGRQRLPEQLVARLPQRELVESIATTFVSAALGA